VGHALLWKAKDAIPLTHLTSVTIIGREFATLPEARSLVVERADPSRGAMVMQVDEIRYLVTASAADTGYASAEMLGWLVEERGIKPHIPAFDNSERTDGTFSRADFAYDREGDAYVRPAGKQLRKHRSPFAMPRSGVTKDNTVLYRASQRDCGACALKAKCCTNAPARKVPRSIHEAARDKAGAIAKTEAYLVSRRERKKIEMLFAHLKRILGLDRLRLRGPCARSMSSSSPPQPKTCGNWPS
jgi:hypothetical protein